MKMKEKMLKKKNRMNKTVIISLFICLLCFSIYAYPQSEQPIEEKPRVFIDCETCDLASIQKDIRFVTFVQSADEAQIHVLISPIEECQKSQ